MGATGRRAVSVRPVRVAVLTVSDGVAHGAREDRSGQAMAEGLSARGHVVVARAVVADEAARIAASVRDWCDGEDPPDAVVTLGGTGLGPRDVTPEATAPLLDRTLPGVAEALRAQGARTTRAAYLSRGVAGVRGRTVVVNVAGSVGAATDALALLGDLIPHAAHILTGGGHEAHEGPRAVRPAGGGGDHGR